MLLTVLGVPSSAGAYGVGQERAPEAFRDAGLIEVLRNRGLTVTDAGDDPVERFAPDPVRRSAQNLPRVVEVAQRTAARAEAAIGSGSLPVVIGGDCTITLGVISGVTRARGEPVVAYFDEDLDILTPETSRSGVLDAMVVAHMLALDGACQPLATVGGDPPLVNGRDLTLVGYGDMNAEEASLLDEREVGWFSAAQVGQDPSAVGRAVLDRLDGQRPLVVHFDVDAVDSIDCPLADMPHFNTGVSLADATDCLRVLCSAPNLAALVVTEVNPDHDPECTHLPRLIGSLATALSNVA